MSGQQASSTSKEKAVFGGGCFWCTEAVFQRLRGVHQVTSGYTGGTTATPRYEDLHDKKTGHVEAVEVDYDPTVISYETLLDVFFGSHDPTTINRQGNDAGEEYRSVIFYAKEQHKEAAVAKIHELTWLKVFDSPIVTTVEPLTTFFPAEPEHQDFYNRNPESSYCQVIITPKIIKLRQKFVHLLKDQS